MSSRDKIINNFKTGTAEYHTGVEPSEWQAPFHCIGFAPTKPALEQLSRERTQI